MASREGPAVVIHNPQFEMTDDIMRQVFEAIDLSDPILLFSAPSGRTPEAVDKLGNYLISKGVPIAAHNKWSNARPIIMSKPIEFKIDEKRRFSGCRQIVFVDMSV